MIYDKIENFKKYPYGKAWEQAFQFISKLREESEDKRYDLGDGMFAVVMSYDTKIQDNAVLETHKKYVDIQSTIAGAEKIEWFYREDLEVLVAYDSNRDAEFYKYPGDPKAVVHNLPKYFTAFWPEDAHMPQLKVGNVQEVKKVVVKVPIELM